MNVLVLNTGSSSLKFQVIDTDLDAHRAERRPAARPGRDRADRQRGARHLPGRGQGRRCGARRPLRDHRAALDYVLRWLVSPGGRRPRHRLGRRHPRGGPPRRARRREVHAARVLIDDEVIDQIEDCIDLAPLHNPANLKGIYAARELLGPGVPQVAVFDTSFHSTMPEVVVPLRDPLPAVRAAQDPPLRLPRHLAPLRGLPLPEPDRQAARGHEHHHRPPRQRLLGLRHPEGRVGRHLDGPHPARGPGDGHPQRQHRPLDPRVPAPQGGDVLRRDRRPAQQAVRASSASRA